MLDTETFEKQPLTIAVYLTLPGTECWHPGSAALTMLRYILAGAIRARSALFESDRLEDSIIIVAHRTKVFGLIKATDKAPALSAIQLELTRLGFLDGAHIAWLSDEMGFVNFYPKNPGKTMIQRMDEIEKWLQERDAAAARLAPYAPALKSLLQPPKPSAPPPPLLPTDE